MRSGILNDSRMEPTRKFLTQTLSCQKSSTYQTLVTFWTLFCRIFQPPKLALRTSELTKRQLTGQLQRHPHFNKDGFFPIRKRWQGLICATKKYEELTQPTQPTDLCQQKKHVEDPSQINPPPVVWNEMFFPQQVGWGGDYAATAKELPQRYRRLGTGIWFHLHFAIQYIASDSHMIIYIETSYSKR